MMEGQMELGAQQPASSCDSSQMWSRPPLLFQYGWVSGSHCCAPCSILAACITLGPAPPSPPLLNKQCHKSHPCPEQLWDHSVSHDLGSAFYFPWADFHWKGQTNAQSLNFLLHARNLRPAARRAQGDCAFCTVDLAQAIHVSKWKECKAIPAQAHSFQTALVRWREAPETLVDQ